MSWNNNLVNYSNEFNLSNEKVDNKFETYVITKNIFSQRLLGIISPRIIALTCFIIFRSFLSLNVFDFYE